MGKPRRIIHWLLSILFLLLGLGSFGSGSTASGVIFLILALFFLPFPPFSKIWTAGKKRVKVFSILATVLLLFIGCGVMSPSKTANSGSDTATAVTAVTPSPTSDITETPVPTETATPTPTETETPTPTPTETETPTPTPTEVPAAFDVSAIPAYTSDPYVAVNNNTPFFADSDLTATSYETYGDLDSLGRCTTAMASIGQDLMPTEERGNIGTIKPTGWHTVKYAGIDGNYLYNRCHLIGYQLTGENANEKNLITGTRYMNVEGMEPFENMTADYIKETGNHVLYRVTPIFEGNNLLASGVLMEAKSVEDQGAGLQFCAYCYNIQPGITIDYSTGNSSGPEFTGSETGSGKQGNQGNQETVQPTPTAAAQPVQSPASTTAAYIGNSNTMKFHRADCSSVGQMNDSNKVPFSSREEAINAGYEPCKRCNP